MQHKFNKLKPTAYIIGSRLSSIILTACLLIMGCNVNNTKPSIATLAFRLKPGQLLKETIQQMVNANKIKAGWISASVGSLTQYNIRFANMPNGNKNTGHFEIVSLTGTVSINGSHLHIAVSDSVGKTIGGHLLDSNIVYTTAEIVILYDTTLQFNRVKDGTTPWPELQIEPTIK
jgi:predicted DNA-binding protein with PD1-like motif